MLEARPAVPTDAERIAALLDRCSLRHQGVARSSIEDALERLTSHGADPARDSALVLRDGAAVGFAHSWKAAPGDRKCFARVDPDATGAGVGTLLLERMEARARSGTRLSVTNWAGDVAGPPLLEGRGYETVRHFLTMGCDLAGRGGPPAPWPEGIRVRTLEDDDRTALVAAYRAAFADNWEPSDVDDETWWEDRSEAFDPSLWFLAVSVHGVEGFALCRVRGDAGYVGDVGVVPAARGRGLGYALLDHALREFRRRGLARATLNVDAENLSGALRLYRKAGMEAKPAFTIWERRL